MTGGPDLASAPLARAVLARWSWRPAGAQGMQRLLGGMAAHRAPLLEGAQRLQAWHDALAQRWRPVDPVPPALTAGRAGPVFAGDIAAPPAAVDGAATARGSPEPRGAPGRRGSGGGGLAPVRIMPVSGAGARVQRLPTAARVPARPALTITALAAPAATSAAPLPVPFRSFTPAADPPTGGLVLVAAIGRRFARREVTGGFPEAPSRGPAGGGEIPAARPTVPLVPWRVVDARPSEDTLRRAAARLRASDREGGLPALAAPWAEPALPARRADPAPAGGSPGADLVERRGASEAIAGLSLRLVPPEEAARRLAQGDDATGRRDGAAGAGSEAGTRRESPPFPVKAAIDIDAIVDRVQRELKRRERFERERKGLL